jgi:hypothetical protein
MQFEMLKVYIAISDYRQMHMIYAKVGDEEALLQAAQISLTQISKEIIISSR